MKLPYTPLFFLIVLTAFSSFFAQADLPQGFPDTDRSKYCINSDWLFHLGDPDEPFFEPEADVSGWETVSVPHSLKLTSLSLDNVMDDKTQPTFHREVGWYRKLISIGKNRKQKVFLEFEGAHQVTDLWVNGKHVSQHSIGGYTPFHFDITEFVDFETENLIALRVDNRKREDVPPDPGPFDYVKFSGLYRDVYLVQTNQLRIPFRWESREAGVRVTTPSVDYLNGNATINISTGIVNDSDRSRTCELIQRIIDKDGVVVLKMESKATIPAYGDFCFNQIGGIADNLHLWDLNNPYLYRLNTVILENGNEVDFSETKIGFRKFELDPEKGFRLNGKIIELIGMNRHQHYGYIGDAMPNSLHYKDMLQFKKLGFNVVRTAHYPQDDALIEACDELGILVYEEAPTWISMTGNVAWYDNLEQAARVMVRNHYNHPSIVIWGAGINHRGPVPRIHYAIKQEDPFRYTASQSSRWTGWQTSGVTDIFGNMNYGPVIWDRQEQLLAMEGRRGPKTVAEYKRDPMMPGIISWTAHAYYTFHDKVVWEENGDRTRSGLMTVFRQPKEDQYYWYPTELISTPQIYIVSDWTRETDEFTIYSNCEKLELFVNDKSQGIFYPSKDSEYNGLDHPPYHIKGIPFEHGTIRVDGLNAGEVVISETVRSPEKAYGVRLEFDTNARIWKADGSDIIVGHAFVVDKHGTILKDYVGSIEYEIEGAGSIVGDGKGIYSNPSKIINGRAPVLIRSTLAAGSAVVTASLDNLVKDKCVLRSTTPENDYVSANAAPIYDLKKEQVDIGAMDQLVEFDWMAWNGSDHLSSSIKLPNFENAIVSIQPESKDDGILRWLGEMNVIGKNGFVYGEGVLGIDPQGISLVFSHLPEGNYILKTYHHAPRSNTDSMDPNLEKLKTLRVLDLPYAKTIEVSCSGVERICNVSEGKELQYTDPATLSIPISSNGEESIKIIFKDQAKDRTRGVWLNGFELIEQP